LTHLSSGHRTWRAEASAADAIASRTMCALDEEWEKSTLENFAEAVGVFGV